MLSGNNSILTNVANAKEKTEKQDISENLKINIMEKMTDNNNNGIKKDELKDILEKYFKDVPDDLKEITTLTTKEKDYTIDISEIISNVKLIDEEDDDEGFYIQGTGNVGTNNYPKYKIYGDTKGYSIYHNAYSVNEDWNEIKSSKVKYNGNEIQPVERDFMGNNKKYIWLEDDNGNLVSDVYSFEESILCFTEDTLIYTQNGLIEISKIKVGDKVYSYDEKTEKIALHKVSNVFVNTVKTNLIKIKTKNDWIKSTELHPFYSSKKEWVKAKDLKIGDYLVNNKNNDIRIEDKQIIEESNKINVYNLEVEENHNYYVGKDYVLVHNAPEPWQKCTNPTAKIYGTKVDFN